MDLIRELAEKYNAVSIVGMAKNAGKTTALNFLIEKAYDEGIRLGITSTGRDGESVDLVTETEKPRVYLYEDTLVSVPSQLYELAEAGLEILNMSNYRTSLGELLLCRVSDAGYVQIAGPVSTNDTRKLYGEMLSLGVDMVLIDGAIDRKSIASPESSDAVILSTGAVISRDMSKAVKETAHVVNLYNLPALEEGSLRDSITRDDNLDRILIIKGDEIMPLDIGTGLGSGRYINEHVNQDTDFVYIPGALTGSMLEEMDPDKFARTGFILKDPTRIFVDYILWNKLRKKGFKPLVLENINVCLVTVNPVSPEGYSMDSEVLLNEMEKALPGIPVIDVRK